ncbi:MAG: ATP-binding protein [Dehalococcoidia bacterium]
MSVRRALTVFAASGLLVLAVVGAGGVILARRTATEEAVRDALILTEVVGDSLIEPAIREDLDAGDPGAISAVDDVVRAHVLGDSIVRTKIWSRDGRVLYSDEPRAIGQRFELGEDEASLFDGSSADAGVTDLGRPENAYERQYGKLLEVYYPVSTPSGSRLLFEAYLPYATVAGNGAQIWGRFAPTMFVGLVTLELVQLPLAWSLARALRHRQDERESLLRRAVTASERERRTIAGELHDGPVQDLLGQSYALIATADRHSDRVPDLVVRDLHEMAARTRSTVQALRSLLIDLYPPNLHSEGLGAAIDDLAGPLRARGVTTVVDVEPSAPIPEHLEALLYRVSREALRNAQQHADASRVDVTLRTEGARVLLVVTDDGVGLLPEVRAEQRAGGHLGLELIESLVRDAGGSASIGAVEGGGTRVVVEVPLA